MVTVRHLPSRNPDPSTAKGHHIGGDLPSSFKNPWPSFQETNRIELFKLRFGSDPDKNYVPVPEGPNGTRSDELVKIRQPDWATKQHDKLRATWIGHASFLVETPAPTGSDRGVRILFDPVFSERTSPFSWAGPKRYSPTPCSIAELPNIDIVCISHNHYDHMDIHTIKPLYQKNKGGIHFFVGLGTKSWFLDNIGCTIDEVTELDWWESCEVSVDSWATFQLTCCPNQHFSGRTIWDMGKALWCSWALASENKSLYFAGDTAYQAHNTPSPCPAFAQIGETLGPFDLALLPIGLYSPPRTAGAVHVTPEQSFQIHVAVKSNLSIGMHYGTIRGAISSAYEDVRDPPRRWRQVAEKEGLWCGGGVEGSGQPVDVSRKGVGLCDIGETVAV